MVKISGLLLCAIFGFACVKTEKPQSVEIPTAKKQELWRCKYVDGSNNEFVFWKQQEQIHFEYKPIQPMQSSSGVYSGGTPKQGILTKEQSEVLLQQVKLWSEKTSEHQKSRSKGVSIFLVEQEGARTKFLVSESQLEVLSKLLYPLRE